MVLPLQAIDPDVKLAIGLGALVTGAAATALAVRLQVSGFTLGDGRCSVDQYLAYIGPRENDVVANRAWLYAPAVHEAADHFGISRSVLMGLVHTESRFKPDAGSKAGAIGLAQVMPRTALGIYKRLRDRGQWPFEPVKTNNDPQRAMYEAEGVAAYLDRTDPRQSAWMGAHYLRSLLDKGRTIEETLAGYNAGPARVKAGDPMSSWPGETRAYVPGVLKRAGWYRELYEACRAPT